MDNPFAFVTGIPEEIKAEFSKIVNNAKLQAQIEVLEIESELNQKAGEMIAARITMLKAQLQ
jgi:hypothetical protein